MATEKPDAPRPHRGNPRAGKRERVKFLTSWRVYGPGEIAAFDRDTARGLIGGGTAVPLSATRADGPAPRGAEGVDVDTRSHDLNLAEAGKLVDELHETGDAAGLAALREGEIRHPKHEQGRTGLLKRIDASLRDLADQAKKAADAQK